jgi:hypothetical protein
LIAAAAKAHADARAPCDKVVVKVEARTRDDPPRFVFLGGGAASGKTTAVNALKESDWWRAHGNRAVVVDADEFKRTDPLFFAAGHRDGVKSDVHSRSVAAAEELILRSVNARRDVVYDSTMMWEPYIVQTIEMIRLSHLYVFERGPGYSSGGAVEKYWVQGAARAEPLVPYHVAINGVYADPVRAVPRALIREITTGRNMPVRTLVKSFRFFSRNFPTYVALVDEVVLYDNSKWVAFEKGERPSIVAFKNAVSGGANGDGTLQVQEAAVYERFLSLAHLNPMAVSVDTLFGDDVPPPSGSATPTPPPPHFK